MPANSRWDLIRRLRVNVVVCCKKVFTFFTNCIFCCTDLHNLNYYLLFSFVTDLHYSWFLNRDFSDCIIDLVNKVNFFYLSSKILQSVRIHLAVMLTDTINHLKTKRRPLYLKTQSVPRCKHFLSRL